MLHRILQRRQQTPVRSRSSPGLSPRQPAVARLLLETNNAEDGKLGNNMFVETILSYPREVLQALPRTDVACTVERLVRCQPCKGLPDACALMGQVMGRWPLECGVKVLVGACHRQPPLTTLPHADMWFREWLVNPGLPSFDRALEVAMHSQCGTLVYGLLSRAFPTEQGLLHFFLKFDAYWARRALCFNIIPPFTPRMVGLVAVYLQGSPDEHDSCIGPDILWSVAHNNCDGTLVWLLDTVPMSCEQLACLLNYCMLYKQWSLVRIILKWIKEHARWLALHCAAMDGATEAEIADMARRLDHMTSVKFTHTLRELVELVASTAEGKKLCLSVGLEISDDT